MVVLLSFRTEQADPIKNGSADDPSGGFMARDSRFAANSGSCLPNTCGHTARPSGFRESRRRSDFPPLHAARMKHTPAKNTSSRPCVTYLNCIVAQPPKKFKPPRRKRRRQRICRRRLRFGVIHPNRKRARKKERSEKASLHSLALRNTQRSCIA